MDEYALVVFEYDIKLFKNKSILRSLTADSRFSPGVARQKIGKVGREPELELTS